MDRSQKQYFFLDIVVDAERRTTHRGHERIPLTPKEFSTLLFLLERAGKAVSREAILEAVWPGVSVGDTSLARNISVLRRYFGAECIATVTKFGYCFEAPVSREPLIADGHIVNGAAPAKVFVPLSFERGEGAAPDQQSPDTVAVRRTGAWIVLVAAVLGLVSAAGFRHRADRGSTSTVAQTVSASSARHTPLPAAYEVYLRARLELEQRTLPSYGRAEALFREAVELDPKYAEAYEGLSETYIFMGGILAETTCFPKARQAAQQALLLDPQNPGAHRNLAYLLMNADAALDESEREYRTALRLDPRDARAHHWFAQLLAAERRTSESVHEAETGYELDPGSVASAANYAFMLTANGQADQAVPILKRLLQRESDNDMVWGYLGFSELRLNHFREAALAFHRAAGKSSLKVNYLACEAYAKAQLHDRSEAKRMVAVMEQRRRRGEWVPSEAMVLIYLGLGEADTALDWLRLGTKDHTTTLFEMATEPVYSELHTRQPFQKLYAELGGKSQGQTP